LGKRTFIYIDGLNLYRGILEQRPRYKWLDLIAFSKRIVGQKYCVEKVKYFTAIVEPFLDPGQPKRQRDYLGALKKCYPQMLQVIEGSFALRLKYYRKAIRLNPRNLPSTLEGQPLPPQPACEENGFYYYSSKSGVEVIRPEEKGSDVNLAAHLVNDASKGQYETALVISNDSDLVEAMRIARDEWRKEILWTNPTLAHGRRRKGAKEFRQFGFKEKKIWRGSLKNSQLPDKIGGTNIERPSVWR